VPADVKGIKVRTTATPLEQEFWKRMGAIPIPIDVGEIYGALQQGLVDGEHLQPVWLDLLKHDEVVKYGTEIDAVAVYRVLIINKNSYDRMDAPQRQAFTDAMKFFEDKAYAYNRSLRTEAMKKIAAHGVQIYNPNAEEMKTWRAYGARFMDSDVVQSNVSKPALEEALKAQH
jgi:TRAP-type C4-dicarboxylate transport system substrate-binding protein